jgi:membrane-bound lytic murein transglycosylase B
VSSGPPLHSLVVRWWVARRLVIGLVVALSTASVAFAQDTERGWSFLVEKLVRDGVPRDRALAVFRDARVDAFDGLYFSLDPRESPSLYRNLRTRQTAERAQLCIDAHREHFEAAESRYGVPSHLVASIVQVESGCGRNTGRARILPALARLSMAAEPENLQRNIERHTLLNQVRSPMNVSSFARWRAEHLENMFYPELRATFDIAARMQVDPLEIRGSGSGAFGIPQFLPRSYLWFGVDGDRDGHVSLYYPADAIASCAHYLRQYGWRADLTRAERRNVIWGYNHSDAYIDTVLWLSDEVGGPTPEPETPRTVRPRRPAARSTRSAARKPAVRKATATAAPKKGATAAKAASSKPVSKKAAAKQAAPKKAASTKAAPAKTKPKAKAAPHEAAPAKPSPSRG